MSMFSELVDYDWSRLEKQPMYVKTAVTKTRKGGNRIELCVDRDGESAFRGTSFYVYADKIDDIPENTDVSISINKDRSMFIISQYDRDPYIFLNNIKPMTSHE